MLTKRQRYHRSLAVPEGFAYSANTTAVLDASGVPVLIKQASHFKADLPRPSKGKVVGELEALDVLPQEPNQVTWRLVRSVPLRGGRRLSELRLSESGRHARTRRRRPFFCILCRCGDSPPSVCQVAS